MAQTSSDPEGIPTPFNASPQTFVGRQEEMAGLESALDEALAGTGRFVMLSGAPGIGKTRAAQELGARADQQGAKVLWGRCFEGKGRPPF